KLNNDIEVYRSNGRTANALAAGLGLTFGGLGLAGIVTRAVLFIQGNKKTKQWEERQLTVAPRWSGDGAGLSFSGRFCECRPLAGPQRSSTNRATLWVCVARLVYFRWPYRSVCSSRSRVAMTGAMAMA